MLDKFDEIRTWPSYKRNLQTMELLVNKQSFQDLVRKARRIANIPMRGLSRTSHENEPSCYIPLGDKEDWEWPNRIAVKYSGKIALFSEILKDIFEKFRLPQHFERAVKTYIYYNKLSAPGTDFIIATKHNHKVSPPSLPQIKRFQHLDTKNEQFASWFLDICGVKDCYYPLQTKRLDPKKELGDKILFMKKVELIEKKLKKEYQSVKNKEFPTVKDEDIAGNMLETEETIDDKSHSPDNIRKIVKKIQNTRQYLSSIYKDRGMPQN